MAAHRDIHAYVKDNFGFTLKTCWIAHVKEMSGLPLRLAWNRRRAQREEPRPPHSVQAIRGALKHFGMIP